MLPCSLKDRRLTYLQQIGHMAVHGAHGGRGGERSVGDGVHSLLTAILDCPLIPPVRVDLNLQQPCTLDLRTKPSSKGMGALLLSAACTLPSD